MTLLQILARELKVWPEEPALKPEDDRCCMSDNCATVYFGMGRAVFIASRRADETREVYVSRNEWQAARNEYLESVKALPWPDDATHYVPAQANTENDVFYKVDGGFSVKAWSFRDSRINEMAGPPRNNMRHRLPGAVERLALAPLKSLPPVGAKAVAVLSDDGHVLPISMTGWADGDELECIAHYAPREGRDLLPVFFNKRVYGFSTVTERCYRLVEDGEAEAVERMCRDLEVPIGVARLVYAKGYRKQADV